MAEAHSNQRPVEGDREAIAFPKLDEGQIERISQVAACRECADGCVLFEAGDQDFKFFVVIDGLVRVVERAEGGDRPVAEHRKGEFTGDVDMLGGRPAVVAAMAEAGTRLLELDAERLRTLLTEDAGLSDVILGAFLMRREILRESGFEGIRLIGSRWSRETFHLKDFLCRHQVPHRWIDLDRDPGTEQMLRRLGVSPGDTPVLVCPQGVLRSPSPKEAAQCLGITADVDHELYDVVIVGGGPGGLAAAVYAASEGLRTLVVEASAPGGQATASSKIENYLGFPTGISGAELAERATLQAQKFRATITSPRRAVSLASPDQGFKHLRLDSDEEVLARTVLIATGADYRRLDAENLEQFEGRGIYYGATQTEAQLCSGDRVAVVGGGNSAGQAAVFLSTVTEHVTMLVREGALEETMSRYLIDRIERTGNITVHTGTQIQAFQGEDHLESLRLQSERPEVPGELKVRAAFIMIGANPRTEWLKDVLALDDDGFIVTGTDLRRHPNDPGCWPLNRLPYHLETSRPGVFAAGDVRSGAVRRVASAVGEGAMAVSFMHQVMNE